MRKEKGQSLVEFLLIIPALLTLILMVVEGGMLMWTLTSTSNAAGEAGRAAQVWEPNLADVTCLQDVTAAVERVTTFDYTLELSDNCLLAAPFDRIPGMEPISVGILVEYQPITGMIFFPVPPVITLRSRIIVNHQ